MRAPVADEHAAQRTLGFRQHGELALEGLAGPPQQSLDRSDLHAFVVGDLLVGPTRALAHGQDVAVADGEAAECPVDQLTVDGGQDQLLGSLAAAGVHRVLCAELEILGGRAAGAAAQHVGADVAGDDGQPGVEAAFPGEVGQGLPGPGEGFLRRVLSFVTVVQAAEAETEEALVVPGVEVAEGS